MSVYILLHLICCERLFCLKTIKKTWPHVTIHVLKKREEYFNSLFRQSVDILRYIQKI